MIDRGIVIADDHKIALRLGDPDVQCPGIVVLVIDDQSNVGVIVAQPAQGAVGGSVVDNNDIELNALLVDSQHRIDKVPNEFFRNCK